MKKSFLLLISIVLLLSACSSPQGQQEPTETKGMFLSDSRTLTIGGRPADAVTDCDAAAMEGLDLDYEYSWDLIGELSNQEYAAELKAAFLRQIDLYYDGNGACRLADANGCYISLKPHPIFILPDRTYSKAFYCYLFSCDMEPVGRILFVENNGKLDYNNPEIFSIRSEEYNTKVMRETPDRKFLLITNRYDDLLLDEYNTGYEKWNTVYKITGDFFHALDWEAVSVSYNELTSEDNLYWLDFSE